VTVALPAGVILRTPVEGTQSHRTTKRRIAWPTPWRGTRPKRRSGPNAPILSDISVLPYASSPGGERSDLSRFHVGGRREQSRYCRTGDAFVTSIAHAREALDTHLSNTFRFDAVCFVTMRNRVSAQTSRLFLVKSGLRMPMAGLEPARACYGPTDFKSVASAISPHRP
jgi:hypothetical protein